MPDDKKKPPTDQPPAVAAVPDPEPSEPAEAAPAPEGFLFLDYGGNTYTVSADPGELPGDYIEALTGNPIRYPLAVQLLLGQVPESYDGPGQWFEFKATHPKVKDYSGLIRAYGDAIRLSLGE